jgi:hypothetical protein
MSPRLIASVLTTTAVCATLVLAVLLAGCGGGDFEDEDRAGINPPPCKAQPEGCR